MSPKFRFRGLVLVLGATLCNVGCTRVARPGVLDEVDRTRTAVAAKEAAVLAPQASLSAEKLRSDAEQAYRDGDLDGARFLGEHALAAYAHAEVLARLAQAETRLAAATGRVQQARTDYAGLAAEQTRIAAETSDVENQVRVARDALPLTPSEPATPERERARLAAARALSTEARLLCVATQMVAPDSAGVLEDFKAIDELDVELAKSPMHPPIDTAVRLRSACLAELGHARRPAIASAPDQGGADALLEQLSKAGVEPHRDDRGVVVVLRDAFQGTTLKAPAQERLTALGQLAKGFSAFPILVVTHSAKGSTATRDKGRAEAIQKALGDAGAAKVQSAAAGDALPVAEPRLADSQARNERVEIVFVAPAT